VPTLVAAVAPVAVGTALAWRDYRFRLGPALAALIGALAIQAGTNFANDLYDFR
jgi:1,4-dihydroxy-2-naphthoate octaprenyltransferase